MGTVEKEVKEIFVNLLKNDHIGLNDNFFEQGGNSISYLQLISNIYKIFNVEIPAIYSLNNTNINKLSRYILLNQNLNSSKKSYNLLNNSSERKLFCFPPIQGFGLLYNKLAKHFDDLAFYSFDFIEDENRIRQYAEDIIEIKPQDSYVLFGFSAGANLAFETAKELEAKGKTVSHIIIWDSYQKMQKLELTDSITTKHKKDVEQFLNENDMNFATRKVLDKSISYINYYYGMVNNGTVNATIYNFIAENSKKRIDLDVNETYEDWTNSSKTYREIKAFGEHDTMLDDENIDKNLKSLRQVMDNIF